MNQSQTASRAKSAQHFVSGLGSGVASAVLLQPLDLLKTRVQQSGSSSLSATLKELTKSPHVLRSLWRGTVPSALRTGFGSALYFTSLNAIRQNVRQSSYFGQGTLAESGSSDLPKLTKTANLISGAAARTFAGFVLMPLTVIKVRFESSFYAYPSVAAAGRDIIRQHGFRGLFSGFGATAIRDAPYAGTYVLLYELLKTEIGSLVTTRAEGGALPTKMGASLAGTVNFTSAILTGAACSALSNPFDAVKTRIQLQPQKYRNTWHACRKMIAEDGIRSLWDGLALRMSRKAISSALAWTVYEDLIRRMSQSPRQL
ncbi:mitochondrial carrier protein [Sarocladium implicatum]|nr:mitochondrial carrier protein [Sarocladium implicatum]